MDDQKPQFELTEPDFLAMLVKREPALRAYARSLVPDWDLVDEALQEASVTMWQKRGQLENADGFVPWARVILRFKCLRQLEKLRSRRPLLSDEMLEWVAERSERQPVHELNECGQALHACFDQFSAEHRELLLAPHSSTYTVVDLAERREKSPNALYKLLGRLREQLADCVRLRMAGEVRQA
ncbi:MAG: RNA polymerase sigma-70 factor (ECF subfamily) [Porticoccaceae bacterium]|jgi:RNA polymerase sigma-70 factor (ECF subfamily)